MIDLRLYAILDPAHAGGHALPALARAVVAGGATIVQLRDKRGDAEATIRDARAVKAALAQRVPLVINDLVDVALAADADGVHVGPEDMPLPEVRRRVGPKKIVGYSVKSVAEATTVPLDLVDYVGVGGVYATTSKDNPAPPIGTAGVRSIAAALRERRPDLPICGIAGITMDNAAAVIDAGADGVAVISALSGVADPQAAAATLRRVIDGALRARAD